MLSVWLESTHLDVPATQPSLPILSEPSEKNQPELLGLEMQLIPPGTQLRSPPCSWVLTEKHPKAAGPRECWLEHPAGSQEPGSAVWSRFSLPSGYKLHVKMLWQLLWCKKLLPPNLQPLSCADLKLELWNRWFKNQMCCRGWVWGKWFFPVCPVNQLKDNPRECLVVSLGQTQPWGGGNSLNVWVERQNCSSAGSLSLQRGSWAFTDAAEPALLQEQDLHTHPALWAHTSCPACRTTNPALFSSHNLGSCLVNPFAVSPQCWTQLPLAGEGRAVPLHHSCSSFSTSRPLLWHIPLSGKCWRHRRELWRCTNSDNTLHLQLLIPSTAHSAVPLSEQMTGLIPQVFVAVFDNRLNTKRVAGIIWKKRKQLPGLNGCTVMLAACRLQHRKPPLTYIQLAAFEQSNKTEKMKRQLAPKRSKREREQTVCAPSGSAPEIIPSAGMQMELRACPGQCRMSTGTRIFQKGNIPWDIPTGQGGADREGMSQTLNLCLKNAHKELSREIWHHWFPSFWVWVTTATAQHSQIYLFPLLI